MQWLFDENIIFCEFLVYELKRCSFASRLLVFYPISYLGISNRAWYQSNQEGVVQLNLETSMTKAAYSVQNTSTKKRRNLNFADKSLFNLRLSIRQWKKKIPLKRALFGIDKVKIDETKSCTKFDGLT